MMFASMERVTSDSAKGSSSAPYQTLIWTDMALWPIETPETPLGD